MPYSASAQAALLKWVNTFPLRQSAESLDDLVDGHALAQILQDMDPDFDASEIENNTGPSVWLNHKRNMQAVLRGFASYIHRTHPELDGLARFHSLADRPDVDSICEVISAMLAVALMANPENLKYIPIMQNSLDHRALQEVQAIIFQKQEELKRARADIEADDTIRGALEHQDAELIAEEKIGELQNELNMLKRRLADTTTRLTHLQLSYDELVDKNKKLETDYEIMAKLRAEGASEGQVIKVLEDKIRELEDLIATQESQAEDDRVAKSRLQREVETLRQRAQQAGDYEVELRKVNKEMETLSKQAKWAERYSQKLEMTKQIETENQNLRYEMDQLQEKATAYDKLMLQNRQHDAIIKQYQKRIEDYERDRWDMENERKMLTEELRSKDHENSLLKARSAADENLINELNEQIRLGGGGGEQTASTPTPGHTTFNLEQELSDASTAGPNLNLEISRLRAENNLLKSTMGSGTDNANVRKELEDERAAHRRARDNLSEMIERHSVAQEQIEALLNNTTSDGSEVVSNLRTQIAQAQHALDEGKRRCEQLEMAVADKDRELLVLRTDFSVIEKDSVAALEELKATDGLISRSLQEELVVLRSQNGAMTAELAQQRVQLVDALLAKDKLRRVVDEKTELLEQRHQQPATSADDEAVHREQKAKVEELKARLRTRKEQIERVEREKHDLQRKLKAAQEGGAAAAQKAESDQIIKNLQRENALIATAWYDLTSRLQSNHVVLQRRHDQPRSWLNKQRQMVNATPRR